MANTNLVWYKSSFGSSRNFSESIPMNYKTQTVLNWLNNDEGMYNSLLDEARTLSVGNLADYIKEYVREDPIFDTSSMLTDLLNAALSEVDWYEVASTFKEDEDDEDLDEDEDEETE